MNSGEIALTAFIFLSGASALGILFVRNVFYAALLLLTCLLSLAGIYFLLQAESLAVIQIIVYAGGISVLILFGIMLTVRLSGKAMDVLHRRYAAGIALAVSLLAVLSYALSSYQFATDLHDRDTIQPVSRVGFSLFTDYVAPFEIAGVLLLVSLIAAATIVSSRQKQ